VEASTEFPSNYLLECADLLFGAFTTTMFEKEQRRDRTFLTRAIVYFATACVLIVLPCAAARSEVPQEQVLVPAIGLNKFDLLKQYLGTASGGDGQFAYRRVTQAMGRKAMVDARDVGARFFRISATGFSPSAYGGRGDLDLWRRDPAAHWALFDQMMNDLHKHGMQAVLTLVWNASQFPAMTGETIPQLLRNPESKSYVLLSRYVTELVSRYRSHPALLFYELTNELNLGADLDSVARCRRGPYPKLCEPRGNFSTEDVILFTDRLAGLIRELDSSHLISSGFSVPRVFAQRLRKRPEWETGRLETADTRAELERYLRDTHMHIDIVSVHLYGGKSEQRFGSNDAIDLLATLKQITDRMGKPLFVGEFGEQKGSSRGQDFYTEQMLKKLVELRVPYSAIWVWEFYQTSPYTRVESPQNLETGYSDELNAKIRSANKLLGNSMDEPSAEDGHSVRVVLTYPLECMRLSKKQIVYAVASTNRNSIDRVEFLVDRKIVGRDYDPPYEMKLETERLGAGEHEIIARAVNRDGNQADWVTPVLVGKSGSDVGYCGHPLRE